MKKQLEEKLEELKNQKEQMVANLNALIGAIQVLTDLLAKEEPTP